MKYLVWAVINLFLFNAILLSNLLTDDNIILNQYYDRIYLYNSLTEMKSQLERILNSDLSEYKIAVTEHLSSLDHFQECLTERSAFMENFNLLLKEQLQRIQRDPPSEFNQGDNNNFDHKCSVSNKNSLSNSNYLKGEAQNKMKNIEIFIQKNQRLQPIPQQNTGRITKFKVDIIRSFHEYVNKTKKSILDDIERTRRLVLKDVNNYIVEIIDHVDAIYQNKLKQMDESIQKLKKQNYQLKNLERKMFHKLEQSKYEVRLQNKVKTIENQTNLNRNIGNIQLNYSPIWRPEPSVNLNIISDRFSEEKSYWQESQRAYLNKNQQKNQIRRELKQKNEMMIKNSQEVNWKHFTCNLDGSSMRQANVKQNFPLKENLIPSQTQNKNTLMQKQPNLPVLLRKNNNQIDRSLDIPSVRSLVVSYPPVQQGFSILKLGNQIIYKGMWKFRRFHGTGKLTLPEYTYEGDFQYGLFHGRGNLKLGSLQFIGQFKQNKADGQGRLRIGSKNIQGLWRNNSLVQKY